MEHPDYLIHFNPNHDPKTGQFAEGKGMSKSEKILTGVSLGLDTAVLGVGVWHLVAGIMTENYPRAIIGAIGVGGAIYSYGKDFTDIYKAYKVSDLPDGTKEVDKTVKA